MESAISHYLASAFTSVPKGYGKSSLSKYVRSREHQVNNIDLSKLYIQSLNYEKENDKIIIKDSWQDIERLLATLTAFQYKI